jgi:predicted DNA-binding transcriptional regulator YafY
MPKTSSRMLALLSLLQSRRDWPGQVLAERLEVTPRTVRRDVERLRELGYTIAATKGPDGGYRLAPGAELPPLLFDDEQAVAMAVALRAVASSGVELDEAASRALITVQQVMPSRLRHRIDAIRFTDTAAPARVDPRILETVAAAVRDRRTLRFDYGDDRDRPPRRVEPHAVIARGGRWYLVAFALDSAAWRIYRLDRMTPRVPGGAPFAPRPLPAGDARTFLAARMKGATDKDAWPHHAEFRLELTPEQIAPWAGDAEVEQVAAGACRVRVGSWSWAGALAWMLRFDAPFTVLGPPEFLDALPQLVGRIQAARPAD